MSYSITLTNKEVSTLAWATDRGYFPTETFDAMHLAIGEQDEPRVHDNEHVWIIPEHAAWAIPMLREDDPHALFTCIGNPLLDKLIALENSIV